MIIKSIEFSQEICISEIIGDNIAFVAKVKMPICKYEKTKNLVVIQPLVDWLKPGQYHLSIPTPISYKSG
jgi:hypothetical protein